MDLASEFSSITGASELEAANWLEMAGFVLADAVQLYFGAEGQSGPPEAANSTKHAHKHSFDNDLGAYSFDEEIRLPDQVKRQKLVDTDARIETQLSKKITTAFSSGKRNLSEKEKTLSELFKAPLDIMTQTGFEEAKEIAKMEDKWLLVNIQKDSEFQCHALNRDFWSDECVKDMIMCSFTFWQKLDITPDGETFIAYYKVLDFPHLAIIDPRTGASKWQYKSNGENIVHKKLAEKLQDFLGDNPNPSACKPRFPGSGGTKPAAPAQGISSSTSVSGLSSGAAGGVRGEEEEGEDPELAAAIQMSLQQAQAGQVVAASASSSAPVASVLSSAASTATAQRSNEPGFSVDQVLNEEMVSQKDAPVLNSSGATIRAQVRLPSGAKATQTFTTTTEVQTVVQAVAKLIPGEDAHKRFEVQYNFPRKNLSDVLKQLRQEKSAAGAVTLAAIGITADTVLNVIYV